VVKIVLNDGRSHLAWVLAFQNSGRRLSCGIVDASGVKRGSVLALLLYSLKFLSLPFQLRTLSVNLLLLLLLHLFVALELISNKSTSPRSERTTDESPRNRMVNGAAD